MKVVLTGVENGLNRLELSIEKISLLPKGFSWFFCFLFDFIVLLLNKTIINQQSSKLLGRMDGREVHTKGRSIKEERHKFINREIIGSTQT